jgi:calcineurin-like phosphoesterase family protein
LKVEPERFFVTSDTHYAHVNICRGESEWPKDECRTFESVEEMNDALVDGINSTVPEDAVLFHLGDWSMGGAARIAEFRRRLNVREIHLVLGNHDPNLKKSQDHHRHFTSVSEYLEVCVGKQELVLFHYACRVWNASHKGSWLLHGHSHGALPPLGLSMDVGVDTNPWRPYSFAEVAAYMAARQPHDAGHHRVGGRSL